MLRKGFLILYIIEKQLKYFIYSLPKCCFSLMNSHGINEKLKGEFYKKRMEVKENENKANAFKVHGPKKNEF